MVFVLRIKAGLNHWRPWQQKQKNIINRDFKTSSKHVKSTVQFYHVVRQLNSKLKNQSPYFLLRIWITQPLPPAPSVHSVRNPQGWHLPQVLAWAQLTDRFHHPFPVKLGIDQNWIYHDLIWFTREKGQAWLSPAVSAGCNCEKIGKVLKGKDHQRPERFIQYHLNSSNGEFLQMAGSPRHGAKWRSALPKDKPTTTQRPERRRGQV